MLSAITHANILVKNQDEALAFYTEKLGFEKATDMPMGPDARWLTVRLPNQTLEVVLELADWGPEENHAERTRQIGKQNGFVFGSDDCQKTYETLSAKGVEFTITPESMPWGVQAMFKDLYGNTHVIVQPAQMG